MSSRERERERVVGLEMTWAELALQSAGQSH